MKRIFFAAPLALALSGCPRHVVLDPSMVPSRNDPDWTVQSAPGAPSTESSASVKGPGPGPSPNAPTPAHPREGTPL